MSSSRESFTSSLPFDGTRKSFHFANDENCEVEGIASVSLDVDDARNFNLCNVLYVPNLTKCRTTH